MAPKKYCERLVVDAQVSARRAEAAANDPDRAPMTAIVKRFTDVTPQDEAEADATEALFEARRRRRGQALWGGLSKSTALGYWARDHEAIDTHAPPARHPCDYDDYHRPYGRGTIARGVRAPKGSTKQPPRSGSGRGVF